MTFDEFDIGVEGSDEPTCRECHAELNSWDDQDRLLCGLCALISQSTADTSTDSALHERRWHSEVGYGGLPDPVGLPSVGQITDLNQPSDTELSDGLF